MFLLPSAAMPGDGRWTRPAVVRSALGVFVSFRYVKNTSDRGILQVFLWNIFRFLNILCRVYDRYVASVYRGPCAPCTPALREIFNRKDAVFLKDFRLILSYLRSCRREFLLAVLFVTAESAFELFIPLVMSGVIDVGVAGRDIPYILRQGLLMVFCALLSLICGLLYARYAARAALGFGTCIGRRSTKSFRAIPLPIWITLRLPP